jgi:hypothetical protein
MYDANIPYFLNPANLFLLCVRRSHIFSPGFLHAAILLSLKWGRSDFGIAPDVTYFFLLG